MSDERCPDDEWRTVVRNVPIVSVDLVVRHDGGVVLGRRENAPARGEWFVPGGRVRKDEPLADAVHRVARDDQHAPLRTFEPPFPDFHPYVEAYLRDAGLAE
ncbi:NUDIX domain-containing protein [Haloplanus salilacus]|uniref:NUDIX domain-containing protein n=1 Tax=Haloplanus salilacus TaxID=2949994 RepID=UPI0030D10174